MIQNLTAAIQNTLGLNMNSGLEKRSHQMGYILKRGWHWQWIYRTEGAWMLIVSGSLALQKTRFKREKFSAGHHSLFHPLRDRPLIILILVAIFGVGTQNGVYLWLVSFLNEA